MATSKLTSIYVPAYFGNYTNGRNYKGKPVKIREITLHHVAGVVSAKSLGRYWQNHKRRGSSHYGIGNDGQIGSYVDENNTAWTNSHWESNCKAVTIEVSNSMVGGSWPVSDKALESLIKLVADIAKRNKLGKLVKGKNLTYHSLYTATICPGPYLMSKLDYIIEQANKINGEKPANSGEKPANTISFLPERGYFKRGDKSPNVGKIALFMYRMFPAYTSKKALGNLYGQNLIKSMKEFQRRTGLVPDGCTGPITLDKLKQYGFKY